MEDRLGRKISLSETTTAIILKPDAALKTDILNSFTFSLQTIRNRLQRLTLLPSLIAVIAGIIVASHTAVESLPWAAISFASLILLYLSRSLRTVSRMLMFATLAAASYSLHHNSDIPLGIPLKMEITITEEGTLRKGYRSYSALSVSEGCEPFKVEVRTPHTILFRRGDKFCTNSIVRPFTKSPTDYSKQMQRLGLQGVVNISAGQISGFSALGRPMLQHRIIDIFCRTAPPTQGRAVAMAIGIGYRGEISREVATTYADCGLSHLLAVSGLHVGMILIFLTIMCRGFALFWRGYEVQSIVLIGLVWLYVWICGMQPSAVRAALLFTLLLLSRLQGKGGTAMLNRLILALILLLIVCPTLLYDIGLQLSAIAVAAIMLYAVPLIRSLRCRSTIVNDFVAMMVVGIVATLATQPLVALTFGKISFISIFLSPLIILLGYVSLIGIQLVVAMPEPLQGWMARLTTSAADMMNAIVEWCSSFQVGYTTIDITTAAVVAIYGGIILVTLFLAGFRRRKEWNIEDI